MKNLEISNIQNVLKKLLKQQKITLNKLAERLNLSEATAKRILSGDDLSMQRVLQICEILQVKFHDVVEISKTLETQYYYFTMEQEKYLAKQPIEFEVLMLLLKSKSEKEIKEKLKLNSTKFELILLHLQEVGFLQLEDNQVTLKIRPGVDWRKGGPLWNTYLIPRLNEVMEAYSAKKYAEEQTFFDFAYRPLTLKSYKQLKLELDKLSKKYAHISKIERLTASKTDIHDYTCLQIMYIE